MIFGRFDPSARKALSLQKDRVFRLFVVMMVLLGWICGVGAATLVTLENIYQAWQLKQSTQVSVYLTADTDMALLDDAVKDLESLSGVERVMRLSEVETRKLLTPYFDDVAGFPVPVVLDAAVSPELDRTLFDGRVKKYFPTAEIDDARSVLESVAHAVRAAQGATLTVSAILLAVMGMIVSLTVKAGVRGQARSLQLLQYIGATDRFVIRLVMNQVFTRAFLGWLLAAALSAVTVSFMVRGWTDIAGYISQTVWVVALAVPLLLLFVALLTSFFTMRTVVRAS